MAELAVQRRHALHGLTLPEETVSVKVSDAGPATRLTYRGATLGDAFGVALPVQPCRAATRGDRSALWLGPDEWLLIAAAGESAPLLHALRNELKGRAVSLVDVSHRNVGLVIEGPRAADLLNAGCPLDLDAAAFPVGMCTRTLFGKAEVVLWRFAPEAFRLEVQRSFAAYVVVLLATALEALPASP